MTVATISSAQNWDLIGLTFGSLIICVTLVALRARRTMRSNQAIAWNSRIGQGQWDFSQSFATNVAVIGSVLTLILSSSALPSTTKVLASNAYGGLAVFFGVLVVIAPLLYNGTADRVTVSADQFDTAAEYHGTVWGFLLAATVTDWGLLGSVATAFVTLLELEYDGSLSLAPLILLAVMLLGAVFFFGRYSWVKIDGTLVDQLDPAAKAVRSARSQAVRANLNLQPPTADNPAPAPRWTLL